MANPKTITFGKSATEDKILQFCRSLAEKKVITLVENDNCFILAAYGTNKTTLKKLLK